jgi:hypothetical protein
MDYPYFFTMLEDMGTVDCPSEECEFINRLSFAVYATMNCEYARKELACWFSVARKVCRCRLLKGSCRECCMALGRPRFVAFVHEDTQMKSTPYK